MKSKEELKEIMDGICKADVFPCPPEECGGCFWDSQNEVNVIKFQKILLKVEKENND